MSAAKRPRGRPRLLDATAKKRMLYLTDLELEAVRDLLKALRAGMSRPKEGV